MLRVFQVGLNTADIAGTLRLYSEALGFRNAGSSAVWGSTIAVQGLGPECRSLMWWMVGAQAFFQLEIFHHTEPKQRPQPEDWQPSDHGWTRFGVAVPDFDACLLALERHRVKLLAPLAIKAGRRHAAFRDPYVGTIVEVCEGDPGERHGGPRVLYATSSVADLESARHFYETLLECKIGSIDRLHEPQDEARLGLSGAERDGFLALAGEVILEIVRYRRPLGRPRRADYQISDQGIMNVGLGARDASIVSRYLKRLTDAGYVPPYIYDQDGIACGYILDAGREVELTSVPVEMDLALGFLPVTDFMC